MAGKNVPIVLIPRYTSYVGGGTYSTLPIPVSAYDSLVVSIWRSIGTGVSPTLNVVWQESNDLDDWDPCAGGISLVPPVLEVQSTVQLTKAWFRLVLLLGPTTNAAMTVWSQGFLILREK